MAANSLFKQRIVTNYNQATYGSESGETIVARACWLSWVFPKKIIRRAVTLLLAAGLALSTGCGDNQKNTSNYGRIGGVDTDGVPMRDISCDIEGQLACKDPMFYPSEYENEYEICTNGYLRYGGTCSEYCSANYGPDSYSEGCWGKDPDNFCNCVQVSCDTDHSLSCESNWNFRKCVDGELQSVSCEEECPFFKDESFIIGLARAYCEPGDNSCTCDYDHLNSYSMKCSTKSTRCVDDTIWLDCVDEEYVPLDCDDYCWETYGENFFATGCDDEAYEHCQCAYGSADGVTSDCQPGEMYCPDGKHLATCESEGTQKIIDCNAYCQQEFGGSWFSERGCEAYKDLENPCSCVESDVRLCNVDQGASCYDDSTMHCYNGIPKDGLMSCDAICYQDHGPGYAPQRCVLTCQCKAVETTCIEDRHAPGDTYCTDTGEIVVAQSIARQVVYSCSEYCPMKYGEDSEALGVCDALASDNPCKCTHTNLFEMDPILPRSPTLYNEE